MEDKPPQRAGREAPRSRTPRAAFSTPEQPTPPSKPAERAPRRAAKSAPPTVTFQPPDEGSEPVPQKKPAPRKAPARRTAPEAEVRAAAESDEARKVTPPAKKAPAAEVARPREPVKAAKATEPAKAAKAAPARKAARKATRTGAKAIPRATTPAQRKPATTGDETAEAATETRAETKADRVTETRAETADTAELRAAATRVGAELAKTTEGTARAVEVKPASALAETPVKGEVERPEGEPRTEAWAKIVADPGHAPELLALAAIQTIGPRAKEWARRTREEYPAATPDALARLAVAQFTRVGSVSSVFAALAGSYAPIALLGVNAYTYAELILHVAAAHGLDPTDPRRAVDLLVLCQVHPDAEEAEAALAIARQPAYEEDARITDAVWRLGRMAATQAVAWMLLKGVNRFFPGATVLAAIMTSRSGARNMGVRATRFYGQENQRPA